MHALIGLAHRQQLAQEALRCALADMAILPIVGEPCQWLRGSRLVLDLHAAWHHIEPAELHRQIAELMRADPRAQLTLVASGLITHPLVIAAFARAVTDGRATCAVQVVS
jgi:hypothetical protein